MASHENFIWVIHINRLDNSSKEGVIGPAPNWRAARRNSEIELESELQLPR